MSRTRIKFCGMTSTEDALAAAELGADAIGMVLHADSPRKISLDLARQVMKALPPFVTPVGLFVDARADQVQSVCNTLGLRHVQLHGSETPSLVESLNGKVVIKALRTSAQTIDESLVSWSTTKNLAALLLDTADTPQPGGTGMPNNWELIRRYQRNGRFAGLPPIIAAGGLRPENVAEVVRSIQPWAVDVSTGIESAKGIKSREKMIEFIRAVRSAEQT